MATPPVNAALLLIDIQLGFDHPTHWGRQRSTPSFEANVAKLLDIFRSTPGAHVVHVYHKSPFSNSPLHPSKPGVDFMPYATPQGSEPVFSKTTNSPFIETDLEALLRSYNLDLLVICGLMTAHCVCTTVRAASNLKIIDHNYGIPSGLLEENRSQKGQIVLVSDATATFEVSYGGNLYDAETVQAVHLSTMEDEFCDVHTTDEVIARLKAAENK
jgi:nicotinamidase-related amidase